jgi:hypothetical protein
MTAKGKFESLVNNFQYHKKAEEDEIDEDDALDWAFGEVSDEGQSELQPAIDDKYNEGDVQDADQWKEICNAMDSFEPEEFKYDAIEPKQEVDWEASQEEEEEEALEDDEWGQGSMIM